MPESFLRMILDLVTLAGTTIIVWLQVRTFRSVKATRDMITTQNLGLADRIRALETQVSMISAALRYEMDMRVEARTEQAQQRLNALSELHSYANLQEAEAYTQSAFTPEDDHIVAMIEGRPPVEPPLVRPSSFERIVKEDESPV